MEFHHSYGKQTFDEDACFLCGKHMSERGTSEHVFPKWLQNKYDLWNKKLDLLNGSQIPYRQLTIPCCERCNNIHLSRIENEIKASIDNGYKSAIKVPNKSWYLWSAKIFYGILRKELTLPLDRSKTNDGTIIDQGIIKLFWNLHSFMQGFRNKHEFIGDAPYTVLICNLHDVGNSYDFCDNLVSFTFLMRMGSVGVIVSFEDGGLISKTYSKYVDKVGGKKLHPIQFYELYAKISYQIKLRQHTIIFRSQFSVDGRGIARTEMIYSSLQLDDWNQKEFAQILNFHVAHWLSDDGQVRFVPPDKVSSWMYDSTGEPLLLSKDEWTTPKNNISSF